MQYGVSEPFSSEIETVVRDMGMQDCSETLNRVWNRRAYVLVSCLTCGAFRSNAQGLLPPSAEWQGRQAKPVADTTGAVCGLG